MLFFNKHIINYNNNICIFNFRTKFLDIIIYVFDKILIIK